MGFQKVYPDCRIRLELPSLLSVVKFSICYGVFKKLGLKGFYQNAHAPDDD